MVNKLERCAAASLKWADDNAVRFEASKTEATLFSKKRKYRRCEREIRVGTHRARFCYASNVALIGSHSNWPK